MQLRNASIKQKLEAMILITALVVLLLTLLFSTLFALLNAREDSNIRLHAMASVLGANSTAAIMFDDQFTANEILATLSTQPDILWAGIEVFNQKIMAEYRSDKMTERPSIQQFGEENDSLFGNTSIKEPILLDGEMIGYFLIIADMSHVWETVLRDLYLGLGVFLLSMLVALLLSSQLQRLISVPIQRLLDTITTVTVSRDFGCRAERMGDDELGELVDGFNAMLEQIQRYNHELGQYHNELEQLVAERTSELDSARILAEAASQAKSEFLATMSHEIRTPMHAMIGFTDLLESTGLNDIQQDYVHNINSSAESLLTIINDILDFSKMEAGKITLEEIDFSLRSLIDDVLSMFTPLAQKKGVELQGRVAEQLPELLHGDPVRVRQVLTNLLSNAIKFTDSGTVVLCVDSELSHGDEMLLHINVQDSGVGIPHEIQQHLFQPFHQGDGSITRRYGGTGLGLVITQRLVGMMNGQISFSSTPGQGTTFNLMVRLCRAKGDGVPALASYGETPMEHTWLPAGLSVLVVDDNPLNLTVASTLLRNAGVKVSTAESGVEALERLVSTRFDLVLMDVEMPQMSGIDVTRKIRASYSDIAHLPVIAVTAHVFPEMRREVLAAGMNEILAKPYKAQQLMSVVMRWCGDGDHHPVHVDVPPLAEAVKNAPLYDRQAALDAVGGNEAVAQELLEKFLELLPESEGTIRRCDEDGDHHALYEAVHKLAGSASIIGAAALHEELRRLMVTLKQDEVPPQQVRDSVVRIGDMVKAFVAAFA